MPKGDDVQVLTVRTCRWCGSKYVCPAGGSRSTAGCPKCQPSLFDQEQADRGA